MQTRIGLALAWLLAGSPAAAQGQPPVTITILLYNYAQVPEPELLKTRQVVARIYGQVGVTVEWAECPISPWETSWPAACSATRGLKYPEIRLLSEAGARYAGVGRDALGFALHSGSRGVLANVFWDRVRRLAGAPQRDPGVLLGHVLAHELGHLLLGPGSHCSSNLMRNGWGTRELEWAMRGSLSFLPEEAEQIRFRLLPGSAPGGAAVASLSPPE